MRIYHPMIGETRVKTRFLFLPVRIGDQTRWLERATWEEGYIGVWEKKWWVSK